MSAGSAAAAGGGGIEPRHGVRIAVIWAVVTAIAVPLIIFVAGPHIPPFDMSLQSETQHTVNVTLLTIAIPVATLIWVYFATRSSSSAGTAMRSSTARRSPPIPGSRWYGWWSPR